MNLSLPKMPNTSKLGKYYYKMQIAIFLLAAVVCGITRTVLKLNYIDPVSGFYTEKLGITTLFNMVLLFATVTLFLTNRLRRVTSDYPVASNMRVVGVFCAMAGLSILLYALLGDPYPVMEQGYSDTLLTVRDVISLILGLAAGLCTIALGVMAVLDRLSTVLMVPALFGCIWQIYMLVTRFNSFTVLTTISDNLLAVLFMIFATLFFIGQARTIFGLTRKDGRNYTIPAGLCAALTGLLLVVPNFIYTVANSSPIPAPMLDFWEALYVFVMSVYALVAVLSTIRSIKQV